MQQPFISGNCKYMALITADFDAWFSTSCIFVYCNISTSDITRILFCGPMLINRIKSLEVIYLMYFCKLPKMG